MEAVLGSATARVLLRAGGVQAVRAILADSSRIGGLRQSGFAAPSWSQALGPALRIQWNSSSDQLREESTSPVLNEEELQEGLRNYETLVDRSDEDEVDCSHTRGSFDKFLRPLVSPHELKDVAQACYLSNLAYIINEIKGDELERDHRLRLVTSSTQHENAAVTAQFNKTLRAPATAYALAATASYLRESRNSATEQSTDALSRAVNQSEVALAMSTFLNAPEASSSESVDGEPESSTSNPSACGWFVCDELTTATRYFSIQGSETMASWKANLHFQPTQFEYATSGVMVHKGVYEIAKSLYDQMMPLVESHMATYGKRARISFTGHSLGGSLSILLSLMFRSRGVVPVSALSPVYTFGAPSVLSGGNEFLHHLGFSSRHVQSVIIARDLVPRVFSCDIPQQIVEVLKRVNENFRDLPNFVDQRQLYTTTGQLLILQPEARQAPGHPLLPSGSGLYRLDHPTEPVQAAESCFLNSPHPLDILSDASAYGAEGAISRDHDPRSYRKAVDQVLKQTVRCLQRRKRMELWQLRDSMAESPSSSFAHWSPAETTTASKASSQRTSSHFSAIFVHNVHGFNRSSACSYLNLGLRKPIHRSASSMY